MNSNYPPLQQQYPFMMPLINQRLRDDTLSSVINRFEWVAYDTL